MDTLNKLKTWEERKSSLGFHKYVVAHPNKVKALSNGKYIYEAMGIVEAKTASEAYNAAELLYPNPFLIFLDGQERY